MSDTNSDSDDSQEYVSVPMSPRVESSRDFEMEHTLDDSESRGEEPNSNKDKESPKQDVFRVLVTGFGPSAQWEVNPSWLAVQPLHNEVLHTDPANHPRPAPPSGKPVLPIDDKLLVPRPIHISTLEIPATYTSILKIVPKMHLRPPVLPEQVRDEFLKPPPNGYDLMFHIGLAGRGPLRLERCGHKLGYNMKDAKSRYAPLVIPQPKDFSRRGPDGRPVALIERAERERLANSELSTNVPGDSSAKQNHGFGGPSYDNFTDELNTDLDVSRIIQDTRQLGIEALQTIYSSMDAGHYLGDFLYYCSLAESKRSANPYEKRRNTQVLCLHCAPVGYPLESEEVTDAIKHIIFWVCNELQINAADDTPDLPPVVANAKTVPNRPRTASGTEETEIAPSSALSPSNIASTDSTLPARPPSPPPVGPPSPPTHGSLSAPTSPIAPVSQPPPVKPPSALPKLSFALPSSVQSSTLSPPSPVSSTNDSEYHSPS
ncbi:hypothetical protein Agabi119p4_1872 [Agaricus bisporus var. burnettii]|uniref:Peptidase C15, pyroglutamyl peptidase I-like protein n=1 Tax=Agaricus bisporus var. burnettii TaxID=192524 RepID=A0A8H7F7Y9_AGABI|nr:hypothetical protein Agabi119p4_1872 [Agaricus bisporus var. burnettii]